MTLREVARKLLEEGTVQAVLGYRQGSLPFRVRPSLFRSPEDVRELIFTPFCGVNLAKYLFHLPQKGGRVAIVAKGCDGRSLVVLMQEHQVRREDLYILGVRCPGMVDWRKLSETWKDLKEQEVCFEGEGLIVRGTAYPLSSFLEASCKRCRYRSPLVYDVLLGEEPPPFPFVDTLRELWQLLPEKRWAFFAQEFSRCIRCYACRNACPMCYCKECFAESHRPFFLHPSPTLRDTFVFHLGRAMHLAGRCVGCGACERACPLRIPIATLFFAVSETVREAFAFEAGVDTTASAPFVTYREDDPDAFIR